MLFRNIEVDFDIFDADTAEIYETAIAKARTDAVAVDGESLADSIRRQCRGVFCFFDTIFGDGFHKEIFGSSTNLVECLTAVREFVDLVNGQKEALNALTLDISKTAANRAARRVAGRINP